MTFGKSKWILDKHTNDFSAVLTFAQALQETAHGDASYSSRQVLWTLLSHSGAHSSRNPGEFTYDSVNHFFMTLKYYLLGYTATVGAEKKDKENERFIFSPLGRLLLKHSSFDADPVTIGKIFLGLLYGVQFPSPADRQDPLFQLYPFRLIFQLLLDPRLDGRLYNNEVEYLVVFTTKSSHESYEALVSSILKLRSTSCEEMARLFAADEATFVKAVYEWEYYTAKLLQKAGVFDLFEGPFICRLGHPRMHFSSSPKTYRTATKGYIKIKESLIPLVRKMADAYLYDAEPLLFNDPNRTWEDTTKQIYGFYPKEIVSQIEEGNRENELAELTKSIELYSLHPTKAAENDFEVALTEGFNWFKNVRANHIGGPGHTDIECVYSLEGDRMSFKFDVDAKSTERKLSGINPGRMKQHRDEVGSQYTIIITPGYVPAAKRDIRGEPIVILLASTFSEYLMNCSIDDNGVLDYSELDEIVRHHLGDDISPYVSELTLSKFGTFPSHLTHKAN
jgi:type II restriction enzyme